MWVLVKEDRLALYNLKGFEAVTLFQSGDKPGWQVVAIRDGKREVSLARVPDLEAGENLVRLLASEMGAVDLGRET